MKTMTMIAIVVSMMLVGSAVALDDEYCSLNLTRDECISQTKLGNCCWLDFTHKPQYGKDVKGCFEIDFFVTHMKYNRNPQTYDQIDDASFCASLKEKCDVVDKSNFLRLYNLLPTVKEYRIVKINEGVCHV